MNEQPYRNEPGLEAEADSGKMDAYNAIIAHETLRVAVVDNVTRVGGMHSSLRCVTRRRISRACFGRHADRERRASES